MKPLLSLLIRRAFCRVASGSIRFKPCFFSASHILRMSRTMDLFPSPILPLVSHLHITCGESAQTAVGEFLEVIPARTAGDLSMHQRNWRHRNIPTESKLQGSPTSVSLKSVLLTQGEFCIHPPTSRDLGQSLETFWIGMTEECGNVGWCYWNLVARGQGCC